MNEPPLPQEPETRAPGLNFQKFEAGGHWRTVLIAAIVLGVFLLTVRIVNPPADSIIRAKQATGLATAVSIERAIQNFFTEYGTIPDVGRRVTTDSPEGRKLLSILLGLDEKSDKPLNSRAVKFLSVNEGKASPSRNGLIYNATGNAVEGQYDPWGNPYTVELDVEQKERLHFTIASKSIDLEGRRTAVYSPGPDKKLGTADDIKTW